MRISADRADPAYREFTEGVVVTLDGDTVTMCITADEEAGEVLVYDTDATGLIIADGDEARTKVLRGRVVVTLP